MCKQQVEQLEVDWATLPRWKGIRRNYTAQQMMRLRGSILIEHTLARRGAEKLWTELEKEGPVCALGSMT
ncbi:MAG: isocitrate lyase, partial [Gammaproteobacteria bacterium]|nr:isocitrate lyase [Gammaproteobacteria bacterium]